MWEQPLLACYYLELLKMYDFIFESLSFLRWMWWADQYELTFRSNFSTASRISWKLNVAAVQIRWRWSPFRRPSTRCAVLYTHDARASLSVPVLFAWHYHCCSVCLACEGWVNLRAFASVVATLLASQLTALEREICSYNVVEYLWAMWNIAEKLLKNEFYLAWNVCGQTMLNSVWQLK